MARTSRGYNTTFGPSTVTLFLFASVVPMMFIIGAGIVYYLALTGGTSAATGIGDALAATALTSFLLSSGMLVIRHVLRS